MVDRLEYLVFRGFQTLYNQAEHNKRQIINQIGNVMADLDQSVADLNAAVQGVADRVGPNVQALKDALAAAQAADATDQASLSDALAKASTAADAIESDVTALNNVAASPAPAPAA